MKKKRPFKKSDFTNPKKPVIENDQYKLFAGKSFANWCEKMLKS